MRAIRSRRALVGILGFVIALGVAAWLGLPRLQRGLRASELIGAVHSGDRDQVQRLLDRGVDPNDGNFGGFKPLMRSVTVPPQRVAPEIVQLLLWYGADPNIRDERGRTVLDIALSNELPEAVIRMLQSNGGKRATDLP